MKKIKLFSALVLAGSLFVACSDDDDSTPEIVNEEEIITTVTVTLSPEDDGTDVTLQLQDLDGDGSGEQVYTVSGSLVANMVYDGSIVLLNETESPAEDITEEVEEESDEHQFFYTVESGLDLTTEYANFDGDGNPLGTEFTLTTGEASSGTLTFTLRHEPTKPNDGTLADAGGETDVEAMFSVEIE
ncbi:type 1 periplasmic binding fold superfamily protein [Zobellia uliginosa]|uniref:type 1 periplasmic binding fold superfamily protein n=1 Tax=Zobellia uliginosa TaxID=143224 RepID=UPI001C073915|nr:type 1 periplasmic binding fold superfamily protein [Zobellia uliginosa]MBU2948420.1 type 1 periplasmic binding fold superfamily protein [Zobellia uliginosa]